ncbi:hypothetical protein Scep_030708 [Stephania cephalantha]|uniref:Uncharacterized protein n=1 Tax=Stephania cephalantha TaxID=152367 RepID=A0AAP0HGQ8_9MAGN
MRDELVHRAQKVRKENGFVFVIKHSNKDGCERRGKVFLTCERYGKYKGSKLLLPMYKAYIYIYIYI